jgi:hypothetical protein
MSTQSGRISAKALACGLLVFAGLVLIAPAAAAESCATGQAQVTFTSTGAEQCYVVPPSITSINVLAVARRAERARRSTPFPVARAPRVRR